MKQENILFLILLILVLVIGSENEDEFESSAKTEEDFQASDNVIDNKQKSEKTSKSECLNLRHEYSAVTPRIMRRFKFTK